MVEMSLWLQGSVQTEDSVVTAWRNIQYWVCGVLYNTVHCTAYCTLDLPGPGAFLPIKGSKNTAQANKSQIIKSLNVVCKFSYVCLRRNIIFRFVTRMFNICFSLLTLPRHQDHNHGTSLFPLTRSTRDNDWSQVWSNAKLGLISINISSLHRTETVSW